MASSNLCESGEEHRFAVVYTTSNIYLKDIFALRAWIKVFMFTQHCLAQKQRIKTAQTNARLRSERSLHNFQMSPIPHMPFCSLREMKHTQSSLNCWYHKEQDPKLFIFLNIHHVEKCSIQKNCRSLRDIYIVYCFDSEKNETRWPGMWWGRWETKNMHTPLVKKGSLKTSILKIKKETESWYQELC